MRAHASRVLTIARSAEACGLSVPARRRYDEAGLLVPAEVDARTGYRRYAADQIADAVLVRTLRQIGLPLATVAAVPVLNRSVSRSSRTRRRRPPGAGPRRRC